MDCPKDRLVEIVFDGSMRGARYMCMECGRHWRADFTPVPDLRPKEAAANEEAWHAWGFTDEGLAELTIPFRPRCGTRPAARH